MTREVDALCEQISELIVERDEALALAERRRSSIVNCRIQMKPGDFPFGEAVHLDGYAIVPRDDYEAMVAEVKHLRTFHAGGFTDQAIHQIVNCHLDE